MLTIKMFHKNDEYAPLQYHIIIHYPTQLTTSRGMPSACMAFQDGILFNVGIQSII